MIALAADAPPNDRRMPRAQARERARVLVMTRDRPSVGKIDARTSLNGKVVDRSEPKV
jgi:hypothetical protein